MIIKRLLTGAIKIITLSFISLTFINGSVFASENIDYNVSVASSLTLTIPTSSIVLNLDPSSKTFDSEDLTVSVGTNNKTGYTLTLSTPNNNTDLNRDSSSDSIVAKIETLASGTYTESTFTPDKWGYSINSNTAIPSTITSGYIPFVSGNTLMESSTAVNKDETELTFAAKIDYLQPAGSYATQLNFNLVANPLIKYMQTFTASDCSAMAIDEIIELPDQRDNEVYKVVKLADGNCWMLDNMRLDLTDSNVQATLSPQNTNSTTQALDCLINGGCSSPYATSAVSGTFTDVYTETTKPYIETSYKNTTTTVHGAGSDLVGIYYNYCAASAGSYCYVYSYAPDLPDTYRDSPYDICPFGWQIPTMKNGVADTDLQYLYNQYNSSSVFQQKLSLGYFGYYPGGPSINTFIWSSTKSVYSTQEMAPLDIRGISYTNFSNAWYRSKGTTIRCFLKV